MAQKFSIHETTWGPGSRARRGAGLSITYGWHPVAGMGDVLIAATPRGICFLGFTVDGKRTRAEARLHDYFPSAMLSADPTATAQYAEAIAAVYQQAQNCHPGNAKGVIRDLVQQDRTKVPARPSGVRDDMAFPLDLYGTPFQLTVWRALMNIPFGQTVAYQDIARAIDRPTAPRAVGGAVGDNPVSILVPCHRVIQSNGDITNYGWGTPKKRTLLKMEGVAA